MKIAVTLCVLIGLSICMKENSTIDNEQKKLNVLGTELKSCCQDPMTGFYRDGHCRTGPQDYGTHIICAEMTSDFLNYSAGCGNDLITPRPEYHFPGLKPGDRWCLCISRWMEAERAGVAPPVSLSATHSSALDYVDIKILKKYALGQ